MSHVPLKVCHNSLLVISLDRYHLFYILLSPISTSVTRGEIQLLIALGSEGLLMLSLSYLPSFHFPELLQYLNKKPEKISEKHSPPYSDCISAKQRWYRD